MRCQHEMPFGARLHADGATFRLWAPAAKSAELSFAPSASGRAILHPAEADAEGWWECEVAEAVAHRIGIISHGKLIAIGTLPELQQLATRQRSLEEIFLSYY